MLNSLEESQKALKKWNKECSMKKARCVDMLACATVIIKVYFGHDEQLSGYFLVNSNDSKKSEYKDWIFMKVIVFPLICEICNTQFHYSVQMTTVGSANTGSNKILNHTLFCFKHLFDIKTTTGEDNITTEIKNSWLFRMKGKDAWRALNHLTVLNHQPHNHTLNFSFSCDSITNQNNIDDSTVQTCMLRQCYHESHEHYCTPALKLKHYLPYLPKMHDGHNLWQTPC